jgi:hypothetical protein
MYLWTEFEGATIDSAFALTKLLETEGRSAFFSTSNASGESVLIRIIECHFDEDEILARWRGVQALGHPNFLCIDRFGEFLVEGENNITAVYVVFERVDANLGEVLKQGHLSVADTAQIGLSVCSALETLHANGFVHEHIEPRNIYAVGDQVKLRSDCIRSSPEGEAGAEARRRDVEALAVVLMEVLLGASRNLSARDQTFLPAPFDEIVRNGMSGNWGLEEMKAALDQRALRPDLSKGAQKQAAEMVPARIKHGPSAAQADFVAAARSANNSAAKPFWSDGRSKEKPQIACDSQPEPSATAASQAGAESGLPGQKRASMELPVIFGIAEREFRSWVMAGAVLIGVVLIGWVVLHFWFGHHAESAGQPAAAAGSNTATASPTQVSAPAAPTPKTGAQSRVQWRVVAFAYNRQEQAQKKASSLQNKFPNLSPAVFSPTARAPWLVTVGGVMERDAAYALARKAPSLGLPRDTYAQNYTAR